MESRSLLLGKFRSNRKRGWISRSLHLHFFRGGAIFQTELLLAIALHEAMPRNFDPFNGHSIFIGRGQKENGRGKNAITRPFKYLPNETGGVKDSAASNWTCARFRQGLAPGAIVGGSSWNSFVVPDAINQRLRTNSNFPPRDVPDGFDDFLEFPIIRERERDMNYRWMNRNRWKIV